jgi:hypothetical protein
VRGWKPVILPQDPDDPYLIYPAAGDVKLLRGCDHMSNNPPPEDGRSEAFVRGSKRTIVFASPDSLYQTMPSGVTAMP